jgi:hypothetical protein
MVVTQIRAVVGVGAGIGVIVVSYFFYRIPMLIVHVDTGCEF